MARKTRFRLRVRQKNVKRLPAIALEFVGTGSLKKEFCRLKRADEAEPRFFQGKRIRERGFEVLDILKERKVSNAEARRFCAKKKG